MLKSTPPQMPCRSRRFLATLRHWVFTSQMPQMRIACAYSYVVWSVANHSSGSTSLHDACSTHALSTRAAGESEEHHADAKLQKHEPLHVIMLGSKQLTR